MRTLLRSLQTPLEVRPSSSHGRNDCLTDSILLAMEDQGLIGPLDIDMRVQLCTAVRRHLVMACGLSPHNYPFLSHDEHFEAICQVLREYLLPLWLAEQCPSQTSLTCIVYDRFNRQMVEDATGGFVELAETNPVQSAAPGAESLSAVVALYCNTHDNGDGVALRVDSRCRRSSRRFGKPRACLTRPVLFLGVSECGLVDSWFRGRPQWLGKPLSCLVGGRDCSFTIPRSTPCRSQPKSVVSGYKAENETSRTQRNLE